MIIFLDNSLSLFISFIYKGSLSISLSISIYVSFNLYLISVLLSKSIFPCVNLNLGFRQYFFSTFSSSKPFILSLNHLNVFSKEFCFSITLNLRYSPNSIFISCSRTSSVTKCYKDAILTFE